MLSIVIAQLVTFLIEIAATRGSFLLTTQVGGTLAALTVDGDASLSDGYARIPTIGLELTDIQFNASGRPNGTIEVDGQVLVFHDLAGLQREVKPKFVRAFTDGYGMLLNAVEDFDRAVKDGSFPAGDETYE